MNDTTSNGKNRSTKTVEIDAKKEDKKTFGEMIVRFWYLPCYCLIYMGTIVPFVYLWYKERLATNLELNSKVTTTTDLNC